tara:strand:- start:3298 stop:3480 length:183 start_codon:yes stop_codon:yes gene_type:complete
MLAVGESELEELEYTASLVSVVARARAQRTFTSKRQRTPPVGDYFMTAFMTKISKPDKTL